MMSSSDHAISDEPHHHRDHDVSEMHFKNIANLPFFSRIYQKLKADPNTAWIALLIKSRIFRLFIQILGLCAYFGTGIAYYGQKQGWGAGTTIFYTLVTMSTVGYGYHHPTDDESRLFTIFYIIVGVYFVFVLVAENIFHYMKQIQSYFRDESQKYDLATEYKNLNRVIFLNFGAIFCTILIGTFCLMGLEGWTFIEAIYFAVVTSSTVGYGDIPINHREDTYPFLAFYLIFSTILVTFAITNLNEARIKKRQILKISELLIKHKDLNFLATLDRTGEGISEAEFVLSILLQLGMVDEEQDLTPWRMKFRKLSENKKILTTKDIAGFRGTDALGTADQIRDMMIRSGLSLDLMETVSSSHSARPTFLGLPSIIQQPSRTVTHSVDSGVQFRSQFRNTIDESGKAALVRHSEL